MKLTTLYESIDLEPLIQQVQSLMDSGVGIRRALYHVTSKLGLTDHQQRIDLGTKIADEMERRRNLQDKEKQHKEAIKYYQD